MKKQNYIESKIILEEVKKAKKILLNCHRGPDPDSVGNALAMKRVLEKMNKNVVIICPSKDLYKEVAFLKGYEDIKGGVNFKTFDFSEFDLFIISDSSSWDMVSGDKEIYQPQIKTIVIDHHHTNTRYGEINLIKDRAAAVCEMFYLLFEDWGVRLDKDVSTALLSGIIGDTGIFKYPNSSNDTFNIVSKLIESGADKDKIISEIYRSYDYSLVEFWKLALNNLEFDKERGFIYSAVNYEDYDNLGKPLNAKETAVDLFSQTVVGTDFGFMALEREKGKLSISFRARGSFDTSRIALELGGGGHPAASGASIEGMSFEDAMGKVLEAARKYAKKGII